MDIKKGKVGQKNKGKWGSKGKKSEDFSSEGKG